MLTPVTQGGLFSRNSPLVLRGHLSRESYKSPGCLSLHHCEHLLPIGTLGAWSQNAQAQARHEGGLGRPRKRGECTRTYVRVELLALALAWQTPAPPCFRDRSGAEALSALSRAEGLCARVQDTASRWASGLGRWEPEVGSWTLRSGVKSGGR